jgi:hypothetical protein
MSIVKVLKNGSGVKEGIYQVDDDETLGLLQTQLKEDEYVLMSAPTIIDIANK